MFLQRGPACSCGFLWYLSTCCCCCLLNGFYVKRAGSLVSCRHKPLAAQAGASTPIMMVSRWNGLKGTLGLATAAAHPALAGAVRIGRGCGAVLLLNQ